MNKLNKTLAMSLATLAMATSSSPIFAGRITNQGSKKMSIVKDITKPEKAQKTPRTQRPKLSRSATFILKMLDTQKKLEWEREGKLEDLEIIKEFTKKRISDTILTEEIYGAARSVIDYNLTNNEKILETAKKIIDTYFNNLSNIDKFKEILEYVSGFKTCDRYSAKKCYEIIHKNSALINEVRIFSELDDDLTQAAADMITFEKNYRSDPENVKCEDMEDMEDKSTYED